MVTATVLAIVVAFVLFWPRPDRDWRSGGAVLAMGLWMAVRSPVGSVPRPAGAGTGESISGNPDDRMVVAPVVPGVAETAVIPVADAITETLPDLGELLRPEQFQPDEIYISYDPDGRRNLVTTGEHDLTELRPGWYREVTQPHSVRDFTHYLNTHGGAARWDRLAELSSGVSPSDGTEVGVDPDGDHAGQRYRGGTGAHPRRDGARSDGAGSHRRYSPGRSDVPQRAAVGDITTGEQRRIRNHRHCPGCTGHRGVNHGAGLALLRIAGALVVGWGIVWLGGQTEVPVFEGIDVFEYLFMVCGGTLFWMLLKGALRGA